MEGILRSALMGALTYYTGQAPFGNECRPAAGSDVVGNGGEDVPRDP